MNDLVTATRIYLEKVASINLAQTRDNIYAELMHITSCMKREIAFYIDESQLLQLPPDRLEAERLNFVNFILEWTRSIELCKDEKNLLLEQMCPLFELFRESFLVRLCLDDILELYTCLKGCGASVKQLSQKKQNLLIEWSELTADLFDRNNTTSLRRFQESVDQLEQLVWHQIADCVGHENTIDNEVETLAKFKSFLLRDIPVSLLKSTYQSIAKSINQDLVGHVSSIEDLFTTLKGQPDKLDFVAQYQILLSMQSKMAAYLKRMDYLLGSQWLHQYLPNETISRIGKVDRSFEEDNIVKAWIKYWKLIDTDDSKCILAESGSTYLINWNEATFRLIPEFEYLKSANFKISDKIARKVDILQKIHPLYLQIKEILAARDALESDSAFTEEILEGRIISFNASIKLLLGRTWRWLLVNDLDLLENQSWQLKLIQCRLCDMIKDINRNFDLFTSLDALCGSLRRIILHVDYIQDVEKKVLTNWIEDRIFHLLKSRLIDEFFSTLITVKLNLESTWPNIEADLLRELHLVVTKLLTAHKQYEISPDGYLEANIRRILLFKLDGRFMELSLMTRNSPLLIQILDQIGSFPAYSMQTDILESVGVLKLSITLLDRLASVPNKLVIGPLKIDSTDLVAGIQTRKVAISEKVQIAMSDSALQVLVSDNLTLMESTRSLLSGEDDVLKLHFIQSTFDDGFCKLLVEIQEIAQYFGQIFPDFAKKLGLLKEQFIDVTPQVLQNLWSQRVEKLRFDVQNGISTLTLHQKYADEHFFLRGFQLPLDNTREVDEIACILAAEEARLRKDKQQSDIDELWVSISSSAILNLDVPRAIQDFTSLLAGTEFDFMACQVSGYLDSLNCINLLHQHFFNSNNLKYLGISADCSLGDFYEQQISEDKITKAIGAKQKDDYIQRTLLDMRHFIETREFTAKLDTFRNGVMIEQLEDEIGLFQSKLSTIRSLIAACRDENTMALIVSDDCVGSIKLLTLISNIQSLWCRIHEFGGKEQAVADYRKWMVDVLKVGPVRLSRIGKHAEFLQKSLASFETIHKRQMAEFKHLTNICPVLNFISDSDLVDLVCNYRERKTVDKYLHRLIHGIESLSYENGRIIGVNGKNGDYLQFHDSKSPNDTSNPIDLLQWIGVSIHDTLERTFLSQSNPSIVQLRSLVSNTCCFEYYTMKYRFSYTPISNYFETNRSKRFFTLAASAMNNGFGCCLFGPAGSGKTESVKAFGAKIGAPVYVYCCDESFDHSVFRKIFQAIEYAGGIVCLDEFNRLSENVMSSVSDIIQDAVATKRAGVFITLNPRYRGRREMPASVAALFRFMSFEQSEELEVVKNRLGSEDLARKTHAAFTELKLHFGHKPQQDFSLRMLLSVVAGAISRNDPIESSLLASEMFLQFAARSDPNEHQVIERIIEKNICNFQTSPDALSLEAIEHLINLSIGTVVLGTGSKRMLINSIAKPRSIRLVFANASLLKPKYIFGEYNRLLKEWNDGIFTSSLRHAVKEMIWFVFEGGVDSTDLEILNSVLDDTKMLTLPSGERLPIPKSFRIIFDVESLHYLSPAFLSRCQLINQQGEEHILPVSAEPESIDLSMLILHPKSSPEEILAWIESQAPGSNLHFGPLALANQSARELLSSILFNQGYWHLGFPVQWVELNSSRIFVLEHGRIECSPDKPTTAEIKLQGLVCSNHEHLLQSLWNAFSCSRLIVTSGQRRTIKLIASMIGEHMGYKVSNIDELTGSAGQKLLVFVTAEQLSNKRIGTLSLKQVFYPVQDCTLVVLGNCNEISAYLGNVGVSVEQLNYEKDDLMSLILNNSPNNWISSSVLDDLCLNFSAEFLVELWHYLKIYFPIRKDALMADQSRLRQRLQTLQQVNEELIRLNDESAVQQELLRQATLKLDEEMVSIKSANDVINTQKAAMDQLLQELESKRLKIVEERHLVESELIKLNPELEAVHRAISNIHKQQLSELRVMLNPPEPVKLTLEAVFIALNLPIDSWKTMQSVLKRDDLLTAILDYNVAAMMTEKTRDILVHGYLSNRNFTFEVVNRASKACGPLVSWLQAQVKSCTAHRNVEPLKLRLSELQLEFDELEKEKNCRLEKIKAVEAHIDSLQVGIHSKTAELKKLKSSLSNLEHNQLCAEKVIQILNEEKLRWECLLSASKLNLDSLLGDSILQASLLVVPDMFENMKIFLSKHQIMYSEPLQLLGEKKISTACNHEFGFDAQRMIFTALNSDVVLVVEPAETISLFENLTLGDDLRIYGNFNEILWQMAPKLALFKCSETHQDLDIDFLASQSYCKVMIFTDRWSFDDSRFRILRFKSCFNSFAQKAIDSIVSDALGEDQAAAYAQLSQAIFDAKAVMAAKQEEIATAVERGAKPLLEEHAHLSELSSELRQAKSVVESATAKKRAIDQLIDESKPFIHYFMEVCSLILNQFSQKYYIDDERLLACLKFSNTDVNALKQALLEELAWSFEEVDLGRLSQLLAVDMIKRKACKFSFPWISVGEYNSHMGFVCEKESSLGSDESFKIAKDAIEAHHGEAVLLIKNLHMVTYELGMELINAAQKKSVVFTMPYLPSIALQKQCMCVVADENITLEDLNLKYPGIPRICALHHRLLQDRKQGKFDTLKLSMNDLAFASELSKRCENTEEVAMMTYGLQLGEDGFREIMKTI